MKDKDLTNTDTNKDNSDNKNIDILGLLGIKLEDGKIEVDTNMTKNFFEELQSKAQEKVEEIQKGEIDLEKVGIKTDDNKIEIDLNKTKSLLEDIAKKAESFIDIFKSVNKK